MAVIFCPHCRKPITAPADAAGRKAACPHCRMGFVIGGTTANSAAPTMASRRLTWMAVGGAIVVGFAMTVFVGKLLFGQAEPNVVRWEPEKKFIVVVEPPKKALKAISNPPPAKEEPTPAPTIALDEQFAKLVARLNAQRKAAKLSAVAVDADFLRGCQAHANYIATNREHPRLANAAGLQDEDAELPEFSDDGKAAAKASMLAFAEPHRSLDLWLGRLNSRSPLLHPDLRRIGLGAAQAAGGDWVTVLDAKRGHGAEPVAYPASGQTDIPLSFSGGPEVADPAAGFPISLQFPLGKAPTSVAGFLTDERGNRIPTSLSTPEQPLPGVKRPELVGMIPKRQLAPKSVYRVHFSGKLDERRFEKEWEFTTEDDGDESGTWAGKTLTRVNRIRQQAGLDPVELDDDLSQACRSHAKYLVINARRPETQGLGVHREDPKLPGFTPEGQKAAKASDIALGDYQPIDALDGWMATLYHRVPILERGLRRIGFGCARGERLGWVTVLDVASGRENAPQTGPVIWPVEDQMEVPLNFPPGGEMPNPIPHDKSGRAGYPITATFPLKARLFNAEGKLEDAKGQPVACWFSSPDAPANPQFKEHQGTTVCLIPKAPLRPEHTYRVTLKGESADRAWKKSWSFTTAKAGAAADDAIKLAVERFNRIRQSANVPKVTLDAELSKGCQAHADYLARNAAERNAKGFSVTDEDPALPGYSAAGQKSARRSDTFSLAPSTTTQIDDLVGTLFRRSYVLDPRLRRIGLGCALEIGQGWINVLDLNSGHVDGDPVIFPGVGQEKVPLQGRDRVPDNPKSFAGYPITVWFPGQPAIRNARATLSDSTGAALDIWLSSPDAPFETGFPQPNIIGIHPRLQLRPGRVYSVTVNAMVDGVPWRINGRFSTSDE